MKRAYQSIIRQHLDAHRQMVFLSGPRQVGKTTLSRSSVRGHFPNLYLNWDNLGHRELILSGIDDIYQQFKPDVLMGSEQMPVIIFDEIHKFPDWKKMLKGYFDTVEDRCRFIVTGSAKLNVYRRGGDSMMGRYFLYRIHPLSVAELTGRQDFSQPVGKPKKLSEQKWQALWKYGGFPEPFIKHSDQFYQRWSGLKKEQFFKEDMRELSRVYDLSRMELLSKLLMHQVAATTKYSELAKKVRVSEPTIRNWISTLENLYYCFSISPWTKNVTRSLLKEPKIYLWDWSLLEDQGARLENLVACHLHKAVHFWTDIGLGQYDLFYLRDKDKREVDFLVTRDKKPWVMIEVKSSQNNHISSALIHFNEQLKVPHVFQVAADMKFIDKDCFSLKRPMIVPLLTFLSQLV